MKMKVTGWLFKDALKEHELRRDTAAKSFNGSLKKFDDETTKQHPEEVVKEFLAREASIAAIQVAQAQYNLRVRVDFNGKSVSLAEVIKLVGGYGRAEKMFRSATGTKTDRYGGYHDETVRTPDQERAKATITPVEAANLASLHAKSAGRLRAAIATGNGVELEIDNLDPALFE